MLLLGMSYFWQIKSLLYPIVCVSTSWLQRKNQLISKGHKSYKYDFITEYQGRRDPAMKIGMHIILYVHAVWLQTRPCQR